MMATSRIEPGLAQADKEKSFGDFLRTIRDAVDANRAVSGPAQERLTNLYKTHASPWWDSANLEVRAMAVSSGVAGGYTVPSSMWGEILTVVAHTSIVWPRATVVQVDPARNLEVPVLDPCGTPTAGATSHYGLLECDYLSEAQTFPEKAAQFRKVLGNLSQIGGCATVSNALLRNSPMLEETLRFSIAQAVAHRVDFDALRGTGAASQIKGIVGSDGAITTSARGSNTAISWANILLVNASVLPSSKNRGIWCVSPTAEQEILEAGTTNTVGTGFVSPSRTGETMVDVLGRPMYVTDALPALNTTGDCVFIDPKYFLIVDGGLEIAVSTHANFRNGQTVFRFIQNISGAPWINSTLTLTDASTQVSPFVVLGPQ